MSRKSHLIVISTLHNSIVMIAHVHFTFRYVDWVDDTPSLSGYRPFGGWTLPTMKQYAGDTIVCCVKVDKDYRD